MSLLLGESGGGVAIFLLLDLQWEAEARTENIPSAWSEIDIEDNICGQSNVCLYYWLFHVPAHSLWKEVDYLQHLVHSITICLT